MVLCNREQRVVVNGQLSMFLFGSINVGAPGSILEPLLFSAYIRSDNPVHNTGALNCDLELLNNRAQDWFGEI